MNASDSNPLAAALPVEMSPSDVPRVRLIAVQVARTPSGKCRVEVTLEAPSGERVSDIREGLSSEAADVRLGAEATVGALNTAMSGVMRFDVAGAKTVRAFDQIVVLVLVGVSDGGPARLLGAASNEGEVCRAAAVAVLNATNRVRTAGSRSDRVD
jgi:hypothetical protein